MSNQITHRKLGTEPLVGLYYVSECIKCGWVGSSGELTEDAQCLQPVGDDHCWGDTDEIEADRLLELMQAGAFDKPTAQPQGKPVPVMKLEAERLLGTDGEYSVSFVKAGWLDECRKTGGVFYLYAEQPAQAAVVMPEQLIAAIEAEQERLSLENYLMDSDECVKVIREEIARLNGVKM